MNWHGMIIVANTADDTLSVIDPERMKELDRIPLPHGSGPYRMAYVEEIQRLLVVESYSDSICSINLTTRLIDKLSFIGRNPGFIALEADLSKVYVTNVDSESISILDTKSLELIGQITAGLMPQGIDCHRAMPLFAVANTNSKDIWLFETNQYRVIKKIQICGYPCQVLFSHDTNSLYVGCCFSEQNQGKIITIDLSVDRIVSEIEAACVPYRMLETSGGNFLLMTSAGMGTLDVVDLRSMAIRGSIKTGSMANDATIDISGQFAFVTNTLEGTVSVVDWFACKKVHDIKVGNEPNGVIRT